ncbi:hypothetical protein FE36_08090 [Xanthomonas oryzae pv. oryzicola]|nr:hypothetical protein BE73_09655 [Xanthomonas oryzae pv. oryzicola]AKK63805.1 hypothetical protein FE36_08090 [Xanthomonas oryzae pv. oryzicola]
MDHQLSPAAGIEDALHDQALLGRHRAQCDARVGQIVHQLPRRFGGHRKLTLQPVAGRLMWCGVQPRGNFAAQARQRRRQFVATARRFAQPEGYVRRCAFGIFHAQDAVAGVAEL